MRKALLLCSSVLFACLLGEGVLRSMGYQPFRVYDLGITFDPSPFAVPDPQLGYMTYPGKFNVTFKNGFNWSATHGPDSYRITGPPAPLDDPRPELFVYGCSVAYGYGVADAETFPYVLQTRLPGVRVKNYAVPGFAQTQAYLQLKRAIELGEVPKYVVLTYAAFHDIRNTLCRERRKAVYPYNKQTSLDHITYPVAYYTGPNSFEIRHETFRYTEWPLMRYSALVHLLETRFDEAEVGWKQSHEVSKILIKAIRALCLEHGIRLIVAGIQDDALTREMLAFCAGEGIENVDLSFDQNDSSYTLKPFDPHPNARGHAHFAERLSAYFLAREREITPPLTAPRPTSRSAATPRRAVAKAPTRASRGSAGYQISGR